MSDDLEPSDGTDLEVSMEQRAETIRKAKADMLSRLDESDRQAHEHWQRTITEIELDTKRQIDVFVSALKVRARDSVSVAEQQLKVELEHNDRLRRQVR